MVDKRQVPVKIYDWQLVPIVKYSDSPYKSCITLFGELNDREEAQRVRKNGDWIINYHPAFVDTLLGLRLFQLDILTIDSSATELPSQNDKYLLGAGETTPDVEANNEAFDAIFELSEQLHSELGVEYSSYIITDEGRDIRFSFARDGLSLTGEPYFYFWQFKYLLLGYDSKSTYKKMADEIDKEAHSLIAAGNRGPTAEWEAYVKVLLNQLRQSERYYNEGYYDPTAPPKYVTDLFSLKSDSDRQAYVKDYPTDFIRGIVLNLRYYADAYTIAPLTQFSTRLSAETEMLRRINPTVWDAAVNVMRYAAFFRYYKATYPSQWQSFLAEINRVSVIPQVRTPTIMKVAK
jgi:hypothetical protein